jgi:hypothetical protein
VKLLSPKINPIIAHQNCVLLVLLLKILELKEKGLEFPEMGVESYKLKFIDNWVVLKDSGCLICMLF